MMPIALKNADGQIVAMLRDVKYNVRNGVYDGALESPQWPCGLAELLVEYDRLTGEQSFGAARLVEEKIDAYGLFAEFSDYSKKRIEGLYVSSEGFSFGLRGEA